MSHPLLISIDQENMAEKLNISLKHYGSVEGGIAGLSLENLINASEIFGVGLDYLIKGTKETDDSIPIRIKEIYLNCSPEKEDIYLKY